MTLENFIQALLPLFPQSANGFSPETEFRKCPEWNSLVALLVIATVEDEFGVALAGNDIVGARTVRDLFGVVSKKSDNR